MSRVINGKLRLDVQLVDLQVVVSDAIESVRPSAEAKEFASPRSSTLKAGRSLVIRTDSSKFSGTF